MPKAGGTVRALFTQEPNEDAISPSEGDLLVTSSTLYFSSLNINNILNYGEYALPKSGGTPGRVQRMRDPRRAFIQGDLMYANCGDRIAKFDLATGDEDGSRLLPGGTSRRDRNDTRREDHLLHQARTR